MTTVHFLYLVCGIGVPMVTGFGLLLYNIGQIKARMVTRQDLDHHQDRCPAYRKIFPAGESTGVHTLPPP